jgi:succinate dehydrogenase/fumarate reductase flavoprotein subunit
VDEGVALDALHRAGLVVADQPWLVDADRARVAERIQDEMWSRVGLERSEAGLARALDEIEATAAAAPPGLGELASLVAVAGLVARSARIRTESRGAHYRADVPVPDPHWRQHLFIERGRPVRPRPIAVAG